MNKALIRNKGETIKETDKLDGVNWKTGSPLTNPEWVGGPYQLIEDYKEEDELESN